MMPDLRAAAKATHPRVCIHSGWMSCVEDYVALTTRAESIEAAVCCSRAGRPTADGKRPKKKSKFRSPNFTDFFS